MLRTLYFVTMLLMFCCHVQASSVNEDLRIEMQSVPHTVDTGAVPLPEEKKSKPKVMYLRRSIPFLFSGAAAIAELTLEQTRTNHLILGATVLWLGANIVGLVNIYLDYRAS